MAINPVPSVIDLASQRDCDILTEYFAGTTGVVYEPVETDTHTDQSGKLQKFFDLLQDGKDKNGISVLQFPSGGIIWVNRTMQIPRCVGPELRGAGYKFSAEPYLSATTTITAMSGYSEDADGNPTGFTDPFWADPDPGGPKSIPHNPKPPILRPVYVVGLSMRGIAFDGGKNNSFAGDGIQVIAASGSAVNAAKHRYEMVAFRNLARGWSHDQYSPGANSNAGDTYFFSQCMFEGCRTCAYFDSPMDLQTIFDIVGINHCGIGFEVYQAGQLRVRHATLVNTPTMFQASRMESNNRHIYLDGLKCDLFNSIWKPIIYKEVDLISHADGTKTQDTRIGGTRGNVTLSGMMFAEGVGRLANGRILSVADDDGKAQFTLRGNGNPFYPGRFFATTNSSIPAYNLDITVDNGPGWVVHEIASVEKLDTSPPSWEVKTKTDFSGNATGDWFDCNPMVMQTGGAAVTIKESYIPGSYQNNGGLAWLGTGNYGPSSISSLLFVVRCELWGLADIGPRRHVRELLAERANTGGRTWNYYKFTDCWGVWDMAAPPWSYSNYAPETEVARRKFGDGVITEVEGQTGRSVSAT